MDIIHAQKHNIYAHKSTNSWRLMCIHRPTCARCGCDLFLCSRRDKRCVSLYNMYALALLLIFADALVFYLRTTARKGGTKGPDSDHYYEQAPPLPPVVDHLYEHIQDYQKKNSVALIMDAKLDFLDSNLQSIHLVNSDLVNDSVVTTAPLQPSSSSRNTRVENQVGDYVEMRMIIESQDEKCGSSFVNCEDFPVNCGNSSISCGPLAAL